MGKCDLRVPVSFWVIHHAAIPAFHQAGFPANQSGNWQYADFHSLRHLFITNLERAGVRPMVAQSLAPHSDIRLTLEVLTHADLADQMAGIATLPGPPSGA